MSEFKTFADDKLNVAQIKVFCLRLKMTLRGGGGGGGNAGRGNIKCWFTSNFPFFPTLFSNDFVVTVVKTRDCGEEITVNRKSLVKFLVSCE